MKKMISVALACLLMAFGILPVFADDNQTEVKYTVGESFTLSVPADITFTGLTAQDVTTDEVAVENVLLEYGHRLNVTVASANGFQLKNSHRDTSYIQYTLEKGQTQKTTVTAQNNVVLSVTNEEESSELLTFTPGTVNLHIAGDHTDTLTFSVTIGNAN